MSDVDIVIPIHNAHDLVRRCVTSVLQHRDQTKHRVILVDDGSSSPTQEFLVDIAAGNQNVQLIRTEEASGFTKAANRGLRRSTAQMVIVLNSDTEVPSRWIEKMCRVMFDTPDVGIVGPLSNAASSQSIPRSTPNKAERLVGQTPINEFPAGMDLKSINLWLEQEFCASPPIRVPIVHGFCFAIRREVIESVGYFDEASFPDGYGEEDDFCTRAVDAGWSLAIDASTYIWHEKSGSYSSEARRAIQGKSRQSYINLHGERRRLEAVRALRKTAAKISEITALLDTQERDCEPK